VAEGGEGGGWEAEGMGEVDSERRGARVSSNRRKVAISGSAGELERAGGSGGVAKMFRTSGTTRDRDQCRIEGHAGWAGIDLRST